MGSRNEVGIARVCCPACGDLLDFPVWLDNVGVSEPRYGDEHGNCRIIVSFGGVSKTHQCRTIQDKTAKDSQ